MINTTYNAVKYACLFLLERDSQTTTLDIKKFLRREGYFTEQSEVSSFMMDIADGLPLEVNDNGAYRIYALPTPTSLLSVPTIQSVMVPPTVIPTPISTTIPTSLHYVQRDGNIVSGYDSIPHGSTCWKIDSDSTSDPVYVDWYTVSRSQARQAFASVNDVPFHSVRARRV